MEESKTLNQVIEERDAVDERIFNTPGPRFYFWATVRVFEVRRWSNFFETLDEAYEYAEQDEDGDYDEFATSTSLCVTDRPHLFPLDEFAPIEQCVEIESTPED